MFERTISHALLSDEQLTALVGSNIRPLIVGQRAKPPFIAFDLEDRFPTSPTHDGPSLHETVEYSVTYFADSADAVAILSAHGRRILRNYSGTHDDTIVMWTRLQGETPIELAPDPGAAKPIFARTQTYRALARPVPAP